MDKPMTSSLNVSNTDFLKTVIGPEDYMNAHVCAFIDDPGKPSYPGVWKGRKFRNTRKFRKDENQFFTVSTFKPQIENGNEIDVRRDGMVDKYHCLVADDVGTKIGWDEFLLKIDELAGVHVKPTWILETSQGSFHVGYAIKGGYVGHALGTLIENRWTSLIKSLAAGDKDPGCGNLTRYVRLPNGVNTKAKYGDPPPRVILREFNPGRVYDPRKFATKVLGVSDEDYDRAEAGEHLPGLKIGGYLIPEGGADPDNDPTGLGQALKERGLLVTQNSGGAWDIECPFISEHSDRADTGSAYVGPGKIKCHHGHCGERVSQDHIQGLEDLYPGFKADMARHAFTLAQDAQEAAENESGDPEPDIPEAASEAVSAADSVVRLYAYDEERHKFYNLRTRSEIKVEAINTLYHPHKKELKIAAGLPGKLIPPASVSIVANAGCRIVAGSMYAPGHEVPIMEYEGRQLVNEWIPPVNSYVVGQPAPQDPPKEYADLIMQIVGNDAGRYLLMLDWLSMVVGAPERKPGWQWLICADPGWGKDTFGSLCRRLVGQDNSVVVEASMLESDFNSFWAAKKFVIMNEMGEIGKSTGFKAASKVYNKLKVYLSTPPETVTINRKGSVQYEAFNVSAHVMFSNYALPVAMDGTDRRLLVVVQISTKALPVVNSIAQAGNWGQIQAAVADAGKVGQMYRYLWDRWHNEVLRDAARLGALTGHAPMTDAKREMIEAAGTDLDAFIDELTGTGQRFWTGTALKQEFERRRLSGVTYRLFIRRLRDAGAWLPMQHEGSDGDRSGRVWGVHHGERDVVWAMGVGAEGGGLDPSIKTKKEDLLAAMAKDNAAKWDGEGSRVSPVKSGEGSNTRNEPSNTRNDDKLMD